MTPRYYDKTVQAVAMKWWRTLSINEMKAFEKKYNTIYGNAIPSEIAEIYEKEMLTPA